MPIKMISATPASAARSSIGYSSRSSDSIFFPKGRLSTVQRIAQLLSIFAIFTLPLLGCMSSGVGLEPLNSGSMNVGKGYSSAVATFHPVSWGNLPGWTEDNLDQAWQAWLQSCKVISRPKDGVNWQSVCLKASQLSNPSNSVIRNYFEKNFQVYEIRHAKSTGQFTAGSERGLITGYYVPIIAGSRTREGKFQFPLYGYPASWKKNKPSQLPTRSELLSSGMLNGSELAWVEDPVEAASMQIQGSGQIRLQDGSILKLGFAGTNEQPFKSIAQWLISRGEMTVGQASMQGIKAWAKRNPDRVDQMLNANPRFVFFKVMPSSPNNDGVVGSIGAPLTSGRSIAVDWKAIPQGAPIYLSTTYPNSSQLLQRLVFAQDTGSAIIGGVRADYYWGTGDAAGESAGRMKQSGRMWLLLPL